MAGRSVISGIVSSLSQEELRMLSPRAKAAYWCERLDMFVALVGKADGRTSRQATYLLERHHNTSDATLQVALDSLKCRLHLYVRA